MTIHKIKTEKIHFIDIASNSVKFMILPNPKGSENHFQLGDILFVTGIENEPDILSSKKLNEDCYGYALCEIRTITKEKSIEAEYIKKGFVAMTIHLLTSKY